MSDHFRDGSSGTNEIMGDQTGDETLEEIRARIEKIKKRLHYLEQYDPEKLEDVLAQVNEIRSLLA